MNELQAIEHTGLSQFFGEPANEYCHAAVRNRLLVAISSAEIEGYNATHEALIGLLRELEAAKLHVQSLGARIDFALLRVEEQQAVRHGLDTAYMQPGTGCILLLLSAKVYRCNVSVEHHG